MTVVRADNTVNEMRTAPDNSTTAAIEAVTKSMSPLSLILALMVCKAANQTTSTILTSINYLLHAHGVLYFESHQVRWIGSSIDLILNPSTANGLEIHRIFLRFVALYLKRFPCLRVDSVLRYSQKYTSEHQTHLLLVAHGSNAA